MYKNLSHLTTTYYNKIQFNYNNKYKKGKNLFTSKAKINHGRLIAKNRKNKICRKSYKLVLIVLFILLGKEEEIFKEG
jgi:hypothetical protein